MNKTSFRQINSYLIFIILICAGFAFSSTYYVSPDGDDSNPGTPEQPFKTVARAISFVDSGTTIYLREGAFRCASKISLSKDGTAKNPIYLQAYPNEIPILDFSDGGVSSSARGFNLSGDYWRLKGFIIQHAGDNAINVSGAHNVVENVIARYNHDSGIQLHTGAAFTQIINCDSYGNYDPGNHGENADGFAAKFGLGEGNIFKGCRAWNNSDDGYDFWEAGNGVTVENCEAFRNGVNRWGDTSFDGDGNGYKLGHGGGAHVLIRCLAFDNPAHGIDVNGNETGVTLYNCSACRNGKRDFNFDDSLPHLLRNNLSVSNNERMDDGIDHQFNSWNDMVFSETDFLSLDTTGVISIRNTDGSLLNSEFLKLAPNSSLIDAGVDVGLAYQGAAPDIGAYESGATSGVYVDARQNPANYQVFQNYPNPFNPDTQIQFYLSEDSYVTITVFNALGERIMTLLDASLSKGMHRVVFNGRSNASGLYFYEIQAGEFTQVKKMVMMQ